MTDANQPSWKTNPRCDEEQLAMLLRCSAANDMTEWHEWREADECGEIWLQGANLSNANLRSAKLSEGRLEGATLKGAHLEGAELWQARLDGADLRKAHIKGACLEEAHLEQADLALAGLEDVSLDQAHLEGANLRRASLERADLSDANLAGAGLTEAHLAGANLMGAHMKGAVFSRADLEGVILVEANLDEADLQLANLKGANAERVQLNGALLMQAHLEGAHLRQARLQGAMLNLAHFEGADLWAADFTGATAIKTHIERANLSSANLEGAHFEYAHLEGTDLAGACLKATNFSFAAVDGKTLLTGCVIDPKTVFIGVGLGGCRIDPGLKQTLEYNVRRKRWREWCGGGPKPAKLTRAKSLTRLRHWSYRWPVWLFWQVSDYGRSTGRLAAWFGVLSALFALAYRFLPGLVVCSDGESLHCFWHAVYFSVVTMTTLGFGDIHASRASHLGQFLLMLQVILGYVLLGALVCRLAILFQAGGPAAKFSKHASASRSMAPGPEAKKDKAE